MKYSRKGVDRRAGSKTYSRTNVDCQTRLEDVQLDETLIDDKQSRIRTAGRVLTNELAGGRTAGRMSTDLLDGERLDGQATGDGLAAKLQLDTRTGYG